MSSRLDKTIATFEAAIHHPKNRCVTLPAAVARELGLRPRADNDILHVSIRKAGEGRWNHHYFKLTVNNEFALPSDIAGFACGDRIEVKVHRVILDGSTSPGVSALDAVLAVLDPNRPGWREDGSVRVDDYLRAEMIE